MSYGKNEQQLQGRLNFRQSLTAGQAARPPSTGKGKPTFLTRFTPSTEYEDVIRVLPAKYKNLLASDANTVKEVELPYYTYVQHYHAGLKKYLNCSAGPFGRFKGKADPCPSCEQFWAERGQQPAGPMSRRELYVFTVLHYGTYANVPQLDYNTKAPRINPSTNQPYMEWKLVRPHERHLYKGAETRDCSVLHWSLGSSHLKSLEAFDSQVGKSCITCGGKDTLKTLHWECSSCEVPLIDPSNTTFTPTQIEQFVSDPQGVECNECGHVGMLSERVECSSGCESPVRADIFNVDLTVKATRDANGKGTSLQVLSWTKPQPIDPRFVEMAKPLDLPAMFPPDLPEAQAQILSGAGARPSVNAASFSKPYGGRPVLGGSRLDGLERTNSERGVLRPRLARARLDLAHQRGQGAAPLRSRHRDHGPGRLEGLPDLLESGVGQSPGLHARAHAAPFQGGLRSP
jgi:hypothetical protein